MTTISGVRRTFPLRVTPVAGEALDSWLEFIAYRHHTPPATILRYCGIQPQVFLHSWLVRPDTAQVERLAAVTGTQPDQLIAGTLHSYVGIETDGRARTARPRPSAWGWRASSRLCPHCLADSGGRWQIAWRLNWSFACLAHHRLLVESCPHCGGRLRWGTLLAREVPTPGRCARAYLDRVRQTAASCSADLTQASGLSLAAAHPAINAQRVIDTLLSRGPVGLPLYRDSQTTRGQILRDIKIIARWAIYNATTAELGRCGIDDLVRELGRANVHRWSNVAVNSSSVSVNPMAAEAAIGLIIATNIVSAPNRGAAARELARLMRSARTADRHCAIPGRAALTAPLRHVHATAHDSVTVDLAEATTAGPS
ncbi:TniQ family protein [Candidatus Mycobacterium wuenschmannii]|uniref:TniQ family protein n=1 Tax=Candidatus Mycobacterium wuenschmannii TaxID=3027808 RepID=A0ABY8W5R4_9MYCO|nr:TniQ family protein [Candidatus Mycobacterium wuenschmannii]WIM89753.1 TniQ family protein [Candidatus Mycobacterium wuenschmannii]